MTFREGLRHRECRWCSAEFTCGSLTYKHYCSPACASLSKKARRAVNDRTYRQASKKRARVAQRNLDVSSGQRAIPAETLALGEVEAPRPLTRSQLIEEVRRLTAGSDEDWFEDLIREWSEDFSHEAADEIRAAVLMLGGSTAQAPETPEDA